MHITEQGHLLVEAWRDGQEPHPSAPTYGLPTRKAQEGTGLPDPRLPGSNCRLRFPLGVWVLCDPILFPIVALACVLTSLPGPGSPCLGLDLGSLLGQGAPGLSVFPKPHSPFSTSHGAVVILCSSPGPRFPSFIHVPGAESRA